MILFPAIDLYNKSAVRLTKGDYAQMTVYSDDPVGTALSFRDAGATHLHVVDLEGARDGSTANFETIREITRQSGLFVEVGGGIRTRAVVEKYLDIGIGRVILGTAAVAQPDFLDEVLSIYEDQIAVGVDVKDGFVAVKGWTEVTSVECFDFCRQMDKKGVATIICTDISKDGLLGGANLDLYRSLSDELALDIVASGGVSTLKDIQYLNYIELYGVILGKALYEGKINLREAVASITDKSCG